MKRSMIFLLALTVLLGVSCKKHPTVMPDGRVPASSLKDVTISITIGAGDACVISDPGAIELHRKKEEGIHWCIKYDFKEPRVHVAIDNFNDATNHLRNPFHDHSTTSNNFDFGPLNRGDSVCKDSEKVTGADGRYKYRILVVSETGKVIGELDPGVIVSD